jgi:Domain of unknown function (DUF4105)
MKILRAAGILLLGLVLLIALLWACGALSFDGPGKIFAVANALALLAMFIFLKKKWRVKLGIFAAWFALVLGWWLTLKPSLDGEWQPNVAQLAAAEIDGDVVTFHNVRNCDYRSPTDYTARWETRTVRLSQITGVDMAVTYWGSPWMAHPIMSFQFADAPPLCFSIETRYRPGQSYSAIGGLYRQFALTYVVADERDVLRLRTNYREGEDVYLYRLKISPEQARARFLEYVKTLNRMREQPRWYNAITTNCTTAIRQQHPAGERLPWDWRLLVNGKGDEMMYERNAILTGGLPFAELKQRVHINAAAREADAAPDFSARIRAGRPGM